jgi:hypothetical protein
VVAPKDEELWCRINVVLHLLEPGIACFEFAVPEYRLLDIA